MNKFPTPYAPIIMVICAAILIASLASCGHPATDKNPLTKCQRLDNGVMELHQISAAFSHGDTIIVEESPKAHKVRVIRNESAPKIMEILKFNKEIFLEQIKKSAAVLPEEIDELSRGDILIIDEYLVITFYRPGMPLKNDITIYMIE